MLPEAGALELVFLAMVALVVVGPKDLPVMLRKIGQFTAKMRGLAAEFRSSFDEMARQSELDDLRREVEALRDGRYTPPVNPLVHTPTDGVNPWSAEAHVSEIAGLNSGFGAHEAPNGAPDSAAEPGEPTLANGHASYAEGDAEPEPELPFDAPPAPRHDPDVHEAGVPKVVH